MGLHRGLILLSLVVFSACAKVDPQKADSNAPPAGQDGCTKISGPNFSDFPVCYKNVDGKAFYQGDIVLGSVLEMKAKVSQMASRGATAAANSYRDFFWPGNIIPYKIEAGVSVAAVTQALADLSARSGLTFVTRTTQIDYISYVSTTDPDRCGFSSVGKVGGRQEVSINTSANTNCQTDKVIQHETLHALGFWHEQSRPDRDNFIRILWSNVELGFDSQFDKLPTLADGLGDYDFGSVMHYSRKAFSYNGEDTIQADTEAHNALIGTATKASANDVLALKAIYGSAAKVIVAASETAAEVTFKSATAVTSKLRYGLTRDSLSQTADVAGTRTSHTINLTGLTAKTRYYYQVMTGLNASNQEVWTLTRSFITDVTPPVIIDPRIITNGRDVELRLTTNENTSAVVLYYSQSDFSDLEGVEDYQFGKIHNLGFRVGQGTYTILPVVTDEAGNDTFGTAITYVHDGSAPVISSVQVTNRTSTGATISWTTNEQASTLVDYGTNQNSLTRVTGTNGVTAHSVALTGLTSNSTYYYKVSSADAAGNLTSSALASFSTDLSGPVISAVAVSNLTASSATVSWTTNELSDSKVTYGSCANMNLTATAAGSVTAHSVPLTGLTALTSYCYKVVSKDAGGNTTTSALGVFVTSLAAAPVLSNIASVVSASSVAVTWTSDIASNSVVLYGTTSGTYPHTATVAGNVTAHAVTLTANLVEGTTYYFKVRSTSASGGVTTSAESSFRMLDTVTLRVVNDTYQYQLARWVYAKSSKPVSGGTTLTMKIVSRSTGAEQYSIGMTYNSSTGEYYAEIPYYYSRYEIYPGYSTIKIVSSLGGTKTWP